MSPSSRIVLLVVVVAVELASCGDKGAVDTKAGKEAQGKTPAGAEKGLALSAEEIRRSGVKVEKIDETNFSELISATGTVVAGQDKLARVLPRASGRILKIDVSLGTDVRAGQVLALIESFEVGEARSAYVQTVSEAKVTGAALERATTLFNEQIIPQKDFLKAKSDSERAAAALHAARGKLAMLGVDPASASTSGSAAATYPLTAPFSGTVIEKKAVLGELTQPDQALFAIADLSTLWIEIDLFERDLARVKVNAKASIGVAAYPHETFVGRLTYVGNTLDKGTRTLKSRVEVANRDRRLKPGMFANVSLDTASSRKGLVIPASAVVLLQGQPTVFVKEGAGFEARAIETEPLANNRLLVKSGLEDDEEIVTSGAYALKARLLKSQLTED